MWRENPLIQQPWWSLIPPPPPTSHFKDPRLPSELQCVLRVTKGIVGGCQVMILMTWRWRSLKTTRRAGWFYAEVGREWQGTVTNQILEQLTYSSLVQCCFNL